MDPEEETYERLASQTSEVTSVYPATESCEDTGSDQNPYLAEKIQEARQELRRPTYLDELAGMSD